MMLRTFLFLFLAFGLACGDDDVGADAATTDGGSDANLVDGFVPDVQVADASEADAGPSDSGIRDMAAPSSWPPRSSFRFFWRTARAKRRNMGRP